MCSEKTEDDMEREAQLLEWRLTLTEERNAVMVPFPGSGIPGAPAEWYDTWHVECARLSFHIFNIILPCDCLNIISIRLVYLFNIVSAMFFLIGFLCREWRLIFLSSS